MDGRRIHQRRVLKRAEAERFIVSSNGEDAFRLAVWYGFSIGKEWSMWCWYNSESWMEGLGVR